MLVSHESPISMLDTSRGYNDYDYAQLDIDKDWSHISNRIIAELANKIFDRKFYYKTLIMNDKTVLEALNYFDEAKTLLN